MVQQRTRGLYFEEFSVGQQVRTPARTITETDVVQFAALSGDWNQLHTDAEYAAGTPFGERIAHGLLGLSVASGLADRAGFVVGTAQAFMGLNWKFRKPILFGDTVLLSAKVAKVRPMASLGGGIVVFSVRLLNQRGETVQQGEWTMLIAGRPSDAGLPAHGRGRRGSRIGHPGPGWRLAAA